MLYVWVEVYETTGVSDSSLTKKKNHGCDAINKESACISANVYISVFLLHNF